MLYWIVTVLMSLLHIELVNKFDVDMQGVIISNTTKIYYDYVHCGDAISFIQFADPKYNHFVHLVNISFRKFTSFTA